MLELIKILKFFKIRKKILKIVINNTSDNSIFKNKLNKVLNRQES